jgi:hypothetical protein
MSKRWMTEIVRQAHRFNKIRICVFAAQSDSFSDLSDFQGMREPRPEEIATS